MRECAFRRFFAFFFGFFLHIVHLNNNWDLRIYILSVAINEKISLCPGVEGVEGDRDKLEMKKRRTWFTQNCDRQTHVIPRKSQLNRAIGALHFSIFYQVRS